jgi:hypothetical protein
MIFDPSFNDSLRAVEISLVHEEVCRACQMEFSVEATQGMNSRAMCIVRVCPIVAYANHGAAIRLGDTPGRDVETLSTSETVEHPLYGEVEDSELHHDKVLPRRSARS